MIQNYADKLLLPQRFWQLTAYSFPRFSADTISQTQSLDNLFIKQNNPSVRTDWILIWISNRKLLFFSIAICQSDVRKRAKRVARGATGGRLNQRAASRSGKTFFHWKLFVELPGALIYRFQRFSWCCEVFFLKLGSP